MKYEYLVFNIIVLLGPAFFGSLKRFYFWNHFKEASIAIVISAIPFLVWDSIVTNRHWFFAEEYTMGIRLFSLPLEEILFFITVPFACLFTWEMVKRHNLPTLLDNVRPSNKLISFILILFALIFLYATVYGKEYTALTSIAFIASIIFDRVSGVNLLIHEKFIFFFVLVTVFTLIFNGYLTWLPIVTYDVIYQLDFRVFTIPIEDFFFGYALLIICTVIFEKLITR